MIEAYLHTTLVLAVAVAIGRWLLPWPAPGPFIAFILGLACCLVYVGLGVNLALGSGLPFLWPAACAWHAYLPWLVLVCAVDGEVPSDYRKALLPLGACTVLCAALQGLAKLFT